MYSESNATDRKVVSNIKAERALEALNSLAVALAGNHRWTKRERWLYGRARGWLISVAYGEDSAA
jgi:hypothetical protein